MPTPDAILAGLTTISNDWLSLAVLWHVSLLFVVISLIAGRRPSQRSVARRATYPLMSAAVAAGYFGLPFNAVIIGLVAVALFLMARQLPRHPVARGPLWSSIIGILMIAFGWVYPHFLTAGSPFLYLIAAPFGLVPCPTLSALIGFTLLGNAFGSRPWSLTLALAGLFYGLFGAFRLGVHLDFVLIFGAAALLALTLSLPRPLAGQHTPAPELPANP